MNDFFQDEIFIWGVMAVISFLVTQGLKWAFIKPFTKNLNKRTKTIINCSILFVAFGSALLCEFIYSKFWLDGDINYYRAYYGWGGSSLLYSIFEMVIKFITGKEVKIENPFNSQEGKDTLALVENVIKDNKINKGDKAVLKEFASNIDKVKID